MNYQSVWRLAGVMCAVGAVCLTGCTTYVTSNVTAFEDWQGINSSADADRTYAFDRSPVQLNDLEQRAYEGLVDANLATHGFKAVPRSQAHFAVSLDYGLHETTAFTRQFADYGGYGGYGGYDGYGWGGGWGGRRAGWGPGWGYGPWWGPPPVIDVPYAAFASYLTVRINAQPDGKEVYKVTARTVSDSGALPQIMPYLVRSAFYNFPLQNGSTQAIRLPVDKRGTGVSDKRY